ncbi:nitrous oxide reductase accessory protein NosL [Dechloromonas sp.]|uniref:nitrous oxide reductase accessory protein NosL n=1 Tax=Dechloromonas sp. TaxID=1917218 RepID=UPI0012221711|nr:nitrous oxide reductase accessory protein NosL [Dechloromonas sp.]MBU3697490.1 nitrous oxide reductase accessory protein NosL [Dechloromonas sp.]TEX44579.1 MAG: nitrous oxide reductase accessory protein NosL [Rhodocyclaceae bacterium]
MLRRTLLGIGLALCASLVFAQVPPKPGPKDLCPVCGMLVSKYPNWVAVVTWKDGHAHFFDGAKDMFKFLNDLPKFAPKHRKEYIAGIFVTDYYNLERIDARKSLFVTGSDVLGPMGHELLPLATRADADDFIKEHKGKRILAFDQIGPKLPYDLDDGKF